MCIRGVGGDSDLAALHVELSCCLPSSLQLELVPSGFEPSCPNQYTWDSSASYCSLVSRNAERSNGCSSTEFWYVIAYPHPPQWSKLYRFSEKATCLPRGGVTPAAPSPASVQCPSGWYWSAQLASCAPANPPALFASPSCPSGFAWSPSVLACQPSPSSPPSRPSPSRTPSYRPSPSPSAGHHSRRNTLKSRAISLCPAGLDACPILRPGDFSDYECVDPKYDLEHCGGCSMGGRGQDCTTIQGVWNVECLQARCSGWSFLCILGIPADTFRSLLLVLTCAMGYVPSIDRKSCIRL